MNNKKKSKNQQEKRVVPQNTAAEIFQFLYFYYLILHLKDGEEIGYEVKEDIHVEYTLTKNTNLVQIKHTILTNAKGKPKNLTEKDPDLWKTINNWVEMVNDKDAEREEYKAQINFIKKTNFSLISNKQNKQNNFLIKIEKFQNDTANIQQIKKYLQSLIKPKQKKQLSMFDNIDTKSDKDKSQTDRYIELLLTQKDEWLELFFNKIKIEQFDNIWDTVFDFFENQWKPFFKEQTISIFNCYYKKLQEILYKDALNKKPTLINNNIYKKELGKCHSHFFGKANITTIKSDFEYPTDLASNPEKQLFIKQLLKIDAFDNLAEEEIKPKMINYTSYRYAAENNLRRLERDEIIIDEIKIFETAKREKWSNIFDKIYSRRIKQQLDTLPEQEKENELINLGQDCFRKLQNSRPLKINKTSLNPIIDNGHFYWLSDIPEIGWRLDWKKLHLKQKNND